MAVVGVGEFHLGPFAPTKEAQVRHCFVPLVHEQQVLLRWADVHPQSLAQVRHQTIPESIDNRWELL